MRIAIAFTVLAACGPKSAPPAEIVGDPQPVAPITSAAIAAALRVAEVHPDGTVLIDAEGASLSIGARMQVAVLESFDGATSAHPVVTVVIDERVDRFLDSDETQTFLVCGDSRGGDPPPLYRAHVTGGSVDDVAPGAASVAWPVEVDLAYTAATGEWGSGPSDEPGARAETEQVQLDDDADPEWTSFVVQFGDATAECPFPYDTWEILFDNEDDDAHSQRLATWPTEHACFSQLPMFHDMACCSEPACAPRDTRPVCRWPPSFDPHFEPDLAPARFTGRTFVANLRGPIAGAVHRGDAAVWIRHRVSFEGEAFGFYHVDGDAIVEAADTYLYHCAY